MAEDRSVADEASAFLAAHPETRSVDAFLIDLNGKAFGKRFPVSDLRKLYAEGTTMCAAMQLTDVQGTSWDTAGMGFSDGDPDAPCRPLPGTLAPAPWAEEPRAQCLMRFEDTDGGLLRCEPRTVLGQVVERMAELGVIPVTAIELEFYLIDPERGPDGAPQPPLRARSVHARHPRLGREQPLGRVPHPGRRPGRPAGGASCRRRRGEPLSGSRGSACGRASRTREPP